MEVSSNCLSDSTDPTTKMEKCTEMKLTKSSKLFSIESIMSNSNKDTQHNNSSINAESPVPQENYYCPQNGGSEYPLPPSALMPPGSHYGNIYNNAWFGGLFNAHFANTTHPDKDMPTFPQFPAFANPTEPPRVPLMFNDPSVINAYQREKLAQYFMNSLRTAGGGIAGVPADCDKLTELIFRSSSGYPAMPQYSDGFSDHQSDKSRSPPFQDAPPQQGLANNGGPSGPDDAAATGDHQRHLSSAIIGCLPLMSKQILGGSEIHQQQQIVSSAEKYDKGSMMDTASNDSCSDDLSLTLSPGESNKHRGERRGDMLLVIILLCMRDDRLLPSELFM